MKTRTLVGIGAVALGLYLVSKKDSPSPQEKKDFVPSWIVGSILGITGAYLLIKK